MIRQFERLYGWLLLSPVILPVVIWGGLIYPYLVPKTLLFYALSFIAVAIFALLATARRPFYFSRLASWPAYIPGALLVLAYVASYFGIGFYHSFWSLFVRGDGLLMLTCAAADFYLILVWSDRRFLAKLARAVALVGTFVAVYGIGEWFVNGGRVGGLLGNAEFFAGYLALAFFANLAAAQGLAGGWRRAAYAGAVLEVVAIIFSATRGTILALGVAALIFLVMQVLAGTGKLRALSSILLVVCALSSGVFFAFRSELAHVSFAPVARVASASTNDPDVASRLFIWKNMVGEIAKRPVLGVGAEHIDALFNTFYDPTQIEEQWFDRSHNAFLDYAAQYGIGGLVLYVALILSFFWVAWRLRSKGERELSGVVAFVAVVYAVQNFFVFDTISSFWLLLALLAVFLAAASREAPARSLEVSHAARWGAYIFAVALVCLLYPVCVRPAEAAYDLAHAYALALIDPASANAYLAHGFALGTYGDLEYGYEAYDMYVNHQNGSLSGDALTPAYQETVNILTDNFYQYSYDARTALYLASVLSVAPQGVPVDDTLFSQAIARAIQESPKRYQAWYILANLSITHANTYPVGSADRLAGYAAAKDILSRYVALVPKLAEPYFVLAELDTATGDTDAATKEAALGKAAYVPDLETARRAAAYYENAQDWTDAEFFLAQIATLDPSDYASRYDLAKVQYLAGDKAAAEKTVEGLRKDDPVILPTDQNFFSAITAYEQSLP